MSTDVGDEMTKACRELVDYIRFSDPASTTEALAKAIKNELERTVAAERAECAKIADSKLKYDPCPNAEAMAAHIAAAIRSRGEKTEST